MKRLLSTLVALAMLATMALVPSMALAEGDYAVEINIMTALYSPVDMENEFWTGIQDLIGVKMNVEWVPAGTEFDTKMELLIASNDVPEVMSIEGAQNLNLLRAINEGYFWNVKDYIGDLNDTSTYPNMKTNIPQMAWGFLSNNGGYYRIPRPRAYLNTTVMVRSDWFAKAGVEDPSVMTIDQYADALETIVKGDYDGNGIADTIGTTFMEELDGAFGNWNMTLNEDGKILPRQLSPQYADFVEWYASLYSRGLMSAEFSVVTDSQFDEMVMAGRMASKYKNIWHRYNWIVNTEKVQPGANYMPVAALTNGEYTFSRFDPGYVGAIVISSKVPEEKMIKILDNYIEKTLSFDVTGYITYGQEGLHHTVDANGIKTLTELGALQVNNSANIPFAIYCSEWFKVDSPVAPYEFNLETRDMASKIYAYGRVNPWNVLKSDTWSAEYPTYRLDFEAMRTKAITGAATMDEFRAYQQTLLSDPLVQQAIEEFTASRNEFFPDGNTKLGKE
ncbi:MAG TPA: hypothetical protein PKE04_06785 [Clostridia bacterium]|nr:hypothetical protein [Clostridia bacterium]